MAGVRQRIARVARSMAPVLIQGESGTGKELAARALHACSHREDGPFVAVNCGAIPDTLLEAEFFGVRKGAYTGATADRPGYFQAARGGTLFLDEIGDLPLPMQAKLLRAIQERCVRPLGATQEEAIDVRFVSATHRDLAQAVQAGQFRQDLYYRLNVIEIRMPALRERPDDLQDLAWSLLQRLCADSGQPVPDIAPEAMHWLEQHPLPGNVRELENLLHRGLALCEQGRLELADLHEPGAATAPPRPMLNAAPAAVPASADRTAELIRHLDDTERRVLQEALSACDGDPERAAVRLGLTPTQLGYRLRRLGMGPSAANPLGD
jgi:two-component system, NtrC family, response regulator PilR